MRKSSSEASIRQATTVVIFTGADDVESAWRKVSKGASAKKNYKPVENKVRSNVEKMIDLAHSLNSRAQVAVLDYWGAVEDGDVAKHDYTKAQRTAAASATDYVNKALAGAARHSRAVFVSTYHLFKGPHGTKNPTKYLAADGNHPNAAGMHAITAALVSALRG
jgi:lysophospholipase L1-like esterase